MRKGWFGGSKPPKNPHSLEHLRYLHHMLTKNQTITEGNKSFLVEALRSMSEILIWGDQNDSSVFEFYLEKNMFVFFLNILQQNPGSYVCVQLLQTLNILFENLQHETSLYYLLSNNHVNEVICHKFDFSDEEVMAYYISFLKTLSLKLNQHTIHFFYNEHTDEFALYTEAIKFFNHSESMVRIATRTLTLNVFKVNDVAMLRFVKDRTAAPYFSNLVWFIAKHVREVDLCVQENTNHQHTDRLRDLVAEHLDHMHYLNDIITLENKLLNEVLIDHLLQRLFLPLYVRSLTEGLPVEDNSTTLVSSVVGLFLLSQVFLIIHCDALVNQLADVIFTKNLAYLSASNTGTQPESLETLFSGQKSKSKKKTKRPNYRDYDSEEEGEELSGNSEFHELDKLPKGAPSDLFQPDSTDNENEQNSSQNSRPFLDTIYSALNCTENDHSALFALCLLYAMLNNKGISSSLKAVMELKDNPEKSENSYNHWLIERLLRIVSKAVKPDNRIRLATMKMVSLLLKHLGMDGKECILLESHLACIEQSRYECMKSLQNALKEEMFLDIFEDEYRTLQSKPLNVEYLMMDSSLLLPPTVTPLTGIEFSKRLPCGPDEQVRKTIGMFFVLRDLSLTFCKEVETQLPLTRQQDLIHTNDKLDLNNSDIIGCTMTINNTKQRRFLVVDLYQLILVEPDSKKLGWGVVKFAGFLQDVEVTTDTDDSRSLHVSIHKPSGMRRTPILSNKFIFDDHIRCMAAKQRLTKGRMRARHLKCRRISVLLDLPLPSDDDPCASSYLLNTGFQTPRGNQFRAFAERDFSQTPTARVHPLLKRPGHAAVRDTGNSPNRGTRIGSLGLPVAQRVTTSVETSNVTTPSQEAGCSQQVITSTPDISDVTNPSLSSPIHVTTSTPGSPKVNNVTEFLPLEEQGLEMKDENISTDYEVAQDAVSLNSLNLD